MAEVKHVLFTGVPLCLLYCEGLNKRQPAECLPLYEGCLMNVVKLGELIEKAAFDKLVVDGQFALRCREHHRMREKECMGIHPQCLGKAGSLVLKVIDVMCKNEQEFITSASCWTSDSFNAKKNECIKVGKINSCLIPCCVNSYDPYPKPAACSKEAVSLVVKISKLILRVVGCS